MLSCGQVARRKLALRIGLKKLEDDVSQFRSGGGGTCGNFQIPDFLLLLIYMLLSQMSNNNLDKVVEDCRRELLECPSSPPDYRRLRLLLDNLSNALYDRFRQLGGIAYLEESIAYYHQTFDLCPIGHPDRSSSLNNLATAVSTRFEQLGGMEDLEEGITCHRQALALRAHDHPDR